MVVTNKPQIHSQVDEPSKVVYKTTEGGPAGTNQVYEWAKSQELRSGRYRLWDYTFQIPWNNLEATSDTAGTVEVGQVTHLLKLNANADSEIYDFPGEYAQRFDAIDSAGQENKNELKKITTDQEVKADNKRTAELRMQAEDYQSLRIQGSSTCPQFVPAHTFTLQRHFNGDGEYVVTSVEHFGSVGSAYRSGPLVAKPYQNTFSCIPAGLALAELLNRG